MTLFAIVFYLLAIAAGLWLVYTLRALIPPFFIAITIALSLAPEIDRMERRGWRRGFAILVIYALFVAAFGALFFVLVPYVSGQLGQVARHLIPPAMLAQPVVAPSGKVIGVALGPHAGAATNHISNVVADYMTRHNIPAIVRAPVIQQVQHVPAFLSTSLSHLGTQLPLFASNLIWVIIVPILAFYFLADYHTIMGKTLLFVRPEKRAGMLKLLSEVVAVFGNYVRGVVLMMLLDIIVTYSILRLLNVQYAETVAVLAGILYAIPYLGAIVSTILIGLVTYSGAGIAKALLVLGIMIFVHQIVFDQIVAPRIIGRQVGLHPLWAISAMMIGGTLLGVGGTLLAIPLAAGAQVVLVHLYPKLRSDNAALLSERLMQEADMFEEREHKTGRTSGLVAVGGLSLGAPGSRSAAQAAARKRVGARLGRILTIKRKQEEPKQ